MAPIEDYALLGDLHTAALVGRDGAIDWLCVPRFDTPACFAALLGTDDAGTWRLAPASGGVASRRSYRGETLVLESEWDTPDGTVRVVDCMPPRDENAAVVRVVHGVTGRVPMRMDLTLRFDYGHVMPWVRRQDDGLTAVAGPDAVWLRTPIPLRGEGMRTAADFEVESGQCIPFVLSHCASHMGRPETIDAEAGVAETERFWTEWISACRYTGRWAAEVRRSLIALKALTFAPTGGILAAATTSLPEQLGGSRNWDYRYCWLRDATFTLQALLGTGFVAEARAWREWLVRAVAGDPADLQSMYGLDGRRRLPELELPWLPGYQQSGPVRTGNSAADQFQLDVWGEVLDGLHLAREAGLSVDHTAWDVQQALLDYLESHWDEPDNGLWEMRGPRQHFVHSKVMAWAGVDRAVRTVEHHHLDGPVDKWRVLREDIHTDVCRNGFDSERNTFVQSYGSQALDAALLLIPRVGFLPWGDERVVGTIDAVQADLCRDGFLLRYDPDKSDDGVEGDEGVFLACSFWLADALTGIGRTQQAVDLFERLLGLRNDVGLLSEEYDPVTRRQLGNTPQAFSMVGLINTARHLTGAASATSARGHEQGLHEATR